MIVLIDKETKGLIEKHGITLGKDGDWITATSGSVRGLGTSIQQAVQMCVSGSRPVGPIEQIITETGGLP